MADHTHPCGSTLHTLSNMTSKQSPSLSFRLLACVLTLTVTHGAPLTRVHEYDPYPQYSFSYDVHDAATGDIKSQQESRQWGEVRGSYSLVEPDGSRRVVRYTAGPQRGFQAIVHREVHTHPAQERPAVHQVHVPLTATHFPIATLSTTPVPTQPYTVAAIATPALAPAIVTRPVLQYIGVRPSHHFEGAPYYQLRLAT